MEKVRLAAALFVVFALAGCASSTLKTESFKKPKTLALVSVVGVVEGLATSQAEDEQLLNGLVNVSLNELERSRHLKLVPEAAVKNSRAFKAIKDDGPGMFQDVAKGYKRFDPKAETANLKALARELKVDGFVGVIAHYGTAKSGVAVGGFLPVPVPVSVGRVKAKVLYSVYAFDASGEIFWQDMVELTSEDGIGTAMGLGQYKALHPKLVTVTKAACKQVVTKLDEQLAAK
jgi:hypothetical protein